MKQLLKIASKTIAIEINKYGPEPQDKYVDQDNADSGPFYNSEYLKWKTAEHSLKTYTIIQQRIQHDSDGFLVVPYSGHVPVGTIASFEILEKEGQCILEHISRHCVQCSKEFSDKNVFTSEGWNEVWISGMCEKCFDDLFKDEEE